MSIFKEKIRVFGVHEKDGGKIKMNTLYFINVFNWELDKTFFLVLLALQQVNYNLKNTFCEGSSCTLFYFMPPWHPEYLPLFLS